MRNNGHRVTGDAEKPAAPVFSVLILIGLVAPCVTFLIAVSGLAPREKIYGLAATSAAYLAICLWSAKRLREKGAKRSADLDQEPAEDALAAGLRSLEEADEFFGGSLKPIDTFRLVSNRIGSIYDFDSGVLFVADKSATRLTSVCALGANSEHLHHREIEKGFGLSGMAMLSGEIEFSRDLGEDRPVLPADALVGMRSTVSMPILFKGETFAVLQYFSSTAMAADTTQREFLEAVRERIGPLLRRSIALEESLSTALTDPLTRLPNERAFFMILENQLAESARCRDERPLSVVAFEVSEAGCSAAAGEPDGLLAFVVEAARAQLRKMDFLARSDSGEFLLILPTASPARADEIITRIEQSLAQTPFWAAGSDVIVRINAARASFGCDGETASQLLETARLRKKQKNSSANDKVLPFPKEFVN